MAQHDVLKINNQHVLRITEERGYVLNSIMGFDAVIIDSINPSYVVSVVKNIRGHHLAEVYLKPIFISKSIFPSRHSIWPLIDGILVGDMDQSGLATLSKEIFTRSLDLNPEVPKHPFGPALKKAFNLMYTRNQRALKPILDPQSIIGYTFPELSISFEAHEEPQVLEALNWAESAGWIWADFMEKIYTCPQCSGGFLSYREVCPHCQSSNTYGEDLIHHFPCANIGPLSDFQKDGTDNLKCPKCDKNLHHIGVDYDKPSILNHCNNCDARFQDVYVRAKCLNCENDVEVGFLQVNNINVYKLTKQGRQFVVSGNQVDNTESSIKNIGVSWQEFNTLVQYDFKRLIAQGEKFAIATWQFTGTQELSDKRGKNAAQSILKEIGMAITENLMSTDYIHLSEIGIFWGVIHDYQFLERTLDALQKNVQGLIEGNLPASGFQLIPDWTEIVPDQSIESQIKKISAKALVE